MLVFLAAIVVSSLLGSMHCVGMCGPLAIFASGAGESASRRQVVWSTLLYHFGRLMTYAIAGMIAGAVGSIVDSGGQALGFQLAAARVVGSAMIVIGIAKIALPYFSHLLPKKSLTPSRVGGWLVKLRPTIFGLPPAARALVTGLLTTLLPCGWLYLFALIAAGTGSIMLGPVVMFAFWLGTLPALTALISGTVALSWRLKTIVPTAVAMLLILSGLFTVSGRGFANLRTLGDIQGAVNFDSPERGSEVLHQILATPLPCCDDPSCIDPSCINTAEE